MRYTLIHDTSDSYLTYTLVNSDFTQAIPWSRTLPDLFSSPMSHDPANAYLSSFVADPVASYISVTNLDLDELTYAHFISKYPEFLL